MRHCRCRLVGANRNPVGSFHAIRKAKAVCLSSMRVRMKRRYRGGRKLSPQEFSEQPWSLGMLQLTRQAGLDAIGLYESGPGQKQEPYGLLYRPVIAALFSDTISFSGVERASAGVWVHQTWYCETRSAAT